MQQYIAIGSLVIVFLLYTALTIYNYNQLIKTKPERLMARRLQRQRRKHPWIWPS